MPNRPLLRIRPLAEAGVSLALCGALWAGLVSHADARTGAQAQPEQSITSVMNATPTRETYTLTYFNRPIVGTEGDRPRTDSDGARAGRRRGD